MITTNKITYIESNGHKVKIHTCDNTTEEKRITICESEKRFSGTTIVRCHRRFLVNTNAVEKYTYQKLILNNGKEIPIGRRYRNNIKPKVNKRGAE